MSKDSRVRDKNIPTEVFVHVDGRGDLGIFKTEELAKRAWGYLYEDNPATKFIPASALSEVQRERDRAVEALATSANAYIKLFDRNKDLEAKLKIAVETIEKVLQQCGSLHKPIYFIWLRELLSKLREGGK